MGARRRFAPIFWFLFLGESGRSASCIMYVFSFSEKKVPQDQFVLMLLFGATCLLSYVR